MNDQTAEAGTNPVPRYSTLMIAIHWSTAILVVVAYMLCEGGPTIRQDPPLLHFSFGLSVLALTIARIAARAVQPVPPPNRAMAPLTARLSRVVHAISASCPGGCLASLRPQADRRLRPKIWL